MFLAFLRLFGSIGSRNTFDVLPLALPEQLSVERAVVDRFGDEVHLDASCALQIRNRPAYMQSERCVWE